MILEALEHRLHLTATPATVPTSEPAGGNYILAVTGKRWPRVSRLQSAIDAIRPLEGTRITAILNPHLFTLQQSQPSRPNREPNTALYSLSVPTDMSNRRLSRLLSPVPGFRAVEPERVFSLASTPSTNDPRAAEQWALHNTGQTVNGTAGTPDADIDAPEAWTTTRGDPTVVVGVIDSGVDITHPDLAPNIYTNTAEIPNNGKDDDRNGYVDDVHGWNFADGNNKPVDEIGHGTHIAGIIAAVGNNAAGISGVAPNAKILPLKFLDATRKGTDAHAIQAIDYAVMLRQRGVNLRVLNNSSGIPSEGQAYSDSIRIAGLADILLVASAGNNRRDTDRAPHYPASDPAGNVISVAATDHRDALASFSNFGKTSVDLGAPGQDILSTLPSGGYGYKNGTSQAAPHVAGVAALLASAHPFATATQIKRAILDGADKIQSLTGKTVSAGRLNANGALRAFR